MDLPDVDIVLYATGLLVWTGVLAWLALRRRDPLGGAAPRPNRLSWVGVLWVVMVYLLTAAGVASLTGWYLSEETDQELAGDLTLACANAASFTMAALACLWLARSAFYARLGGFGLTWRRARPDLCWAGLTVLAVWPAVAGLLWVSERVVLLTLGPQYLEDHRVIGSLENPALPAWVSVLMVLTAVVIAPLAEELFFRGILQTKLGATFNSRWAALAVAGVCFGLVHGGQIAAIIPLAFMGMILGFVYESTGSLIAPILIHALFNTKALIWHGLMTGA